jgi:hypothetical protein
MFVSDHPVLQFQLVTMLDRLQPVLPLLSCTLASVSYAEGDSRVQFNMTCTCVPSSIILHKLAQNAQFGSSSQHTGFDAKLQTPSCVKTTSGGKRGPGIKMTNGDH